MNVYDAFVKKYGEALIKTATTANPEKTNKIFRAAQKAWDAGEYHRTVLWLGDKPTRRTYAALDACMRSVYLDLLDVVPQQNMDKMFI